MVLVHSDGNLPTLQPIRMDASNAQKFGQLHIRKYEEAGPEPANGTAEAVATIRREAKSRDVLVDFEGARL